MNNTTAATEADFIAAEALAYRIADRASVVDIESAPVMRLPDSAFRWYDTRPLLDEREQSPSGVAMNEQSIQHALARGLVQRHPAKTYLVRVLRFPL